MNRIIVRYFRFILIILIVIITFILESGCINSDSQHSSLTGFNPDNTILIASFNIRDFGPAKSTNPVVLPYLGKIIREFDIVAIQEISDLTEQTMDNLLNEVNRFDDYSYILGPRIESEQYAYIYRNSAVELISDPYTYYSDPIEKDPYIAHFSVRDGVFDFALINIHLKHSDVVSEIAELPNAMSDAAATYNENDVICLGDYNADGDYYDEDDYEIVFPSDQYIRIIPNSADTNVAASSKTYDRITATISADEDFLGKGGEDCINQYGVFRFDLAYYLTSNPEPDDISDHYPVWARFYTDRDSD